MSITRSITRALTQPLTRRLTAPGIGGGVEPFDGVFMDTANGDTFTNRLSYTPDASIAVSDTSVAFSSASALDIRLTVKEDDGNVMLECFDYFEVDATYTVTSFPAADAIGFETGWSLPSGTTYRYMGEVKAHPASATRLFRRLILNDAYRVSGASGYDFTPGVDAHVNIQRQGSLLTCTTTFNNGVSSETLTKTMTLTAGSDQLPNMFYAPRVRFISGVSSLTSLKVAASFPGARFAFLGDSLTQGRFATAYADAFPQLIRSDYPGEVIVCGAPSATTTNWLDATRSLIRMEPQTCFVLLGANDFSGGASEATVQANLTTIRSRLVAAGIRAVILTPSPINNIKATNTATWIAAQGWDYIDIYTPLLGTGTALNAAYNFGDGVHWNTAGHAVVYSAITAYIAAEGL